MGDINDTMAQEAALTRQYELNKRLLAIEAKLDTLISLSQPPADVVEPPAKTAKATAKKVTEAA